MVGGYSRSKDGVVILREVLHVLERLPLGYWHGAKESGHRVNGFLAGAECASSWEGKRKAHEATR